jgi:chromosome segregation ATPase
MSDEDYTNIVKSVRDSMSQLQAEPGINGRLLANLEARLAEYDRFLHFVVDQKNTLLNEKSVLIEEAKKVNQEIHEVSEEAQEQLLASVKELSMATAQSEKLSQKDIKNAKKYLASLMTLTIGDKEERASQDFATANIKSNTDALKTKIANIEGRLARAKHEIEKVLPSAPPSPPPSPQHHPHHKTTKPQHHPHHPLLLIPMVCVALRLCPGYGIKDLRAQ